MKKVRWGIVGPGNIARKFAKAVKNVEMAELSAVASRSFEKGKAFADTYEIPLVFGSYEEMAASDKVDAVYIATPHPFHKPCAELFLKAKKHVLCEKPICVTARQAEKLTATAKENGVFLMEAMWTRFLPAINEVCKLVKGGTIGRVGGLSADFCYYLEPQDEPKIYDDKMAGGSLLDVGVYCLHFADLIFGENPESITAVSNIEYDVDCHTHILLTYKDGAIANLSSATNLGKPADALIYGTKGSIRIPCFYGATEFFVDRGNGEERFSFPSIGDGFEEEIIEACKCIIAGKTESETMPLSKSIKMLRQMDAIRQQIGYSFPFDEE